MTLDRAPVIVAGHWAFPLGLGRLPRISASVALFFFASAARAFLRAAGGMVTFVLDIARSLSFGADSSQALIVYQTHGERLSRSWCTFVNEPPPDRSESSRIVAAVRASRPPVLGQVGGAERERFRDQAELHGEPIGALRAQ